jgi:hypothetical protein
MPCSAPFVARTETGRALVPCGQCRPCLLRRKQAWVGRNILEFRDSGVGRFLTLTYRNDCLPELLDYSHIQDFKKRYIYHNGPMRFFCVGEYGGRSGRPHWHILIYGHKQVYRGLIPPSESCWEFGGVLDGFVSAESIGYCSGYVMKPAPVGKSNVVRMSLRPSIGMSQLERLGAEFALAMSGRPVLILPSSYTVFGRRYPLYGGGRRGFERGYSDAGGLPPQSRNPEELEADVYSYNYSLIYNSSGVPVSEKIEQRYRVKQSIRRKLKDVERGSL